MKLVVLSIVLAVLAIVLVIALWLRSGPDPAQFAHLKDPRFSRMPDERMLVVEAVGDPNVVGSRAFGLLFSTYSRLDGVSRAQRPPAPRARWPRPADVPKREWVGQYALPVPEGVSALPAITKQPEFRTALSTWTYGEVAEVLHVGSYSSEEPDIIRLHEFVRSRGYRIVGDHEEEYVRGPGMIFAGDPDKYLTIIRVRVEKAR